MERMKISDIQIRDDLYPRFDKIPAAVSAYAENIEVLPPVEVSQTGILIDGYHRLTAHRQAGLDEVPVTVTEVASEKEIYRLAVERNSVHGHQLTLDDKRRYARHIFADNPNWSTEDEAALAKTLSVSERWIRNALSSGKKDRLSEQKARAERLWWMCHSQHEIADILGISRDAIRRWVGHFGKFAKMPNPEAALYDVWTAQKTSNEVRHPGQTEVKWVERLLGLFTEPGDIVVDPFAGGGSSIDVCLEFGRRILASDLTPIPARENEIRQHDVMQGPLNPAPGWSDVSLVYLDPPYGAQVAGKYSDKPDDLANGDSGELAEKLIKVVNDYRKALRKGAHIALIIQATQWHAPDRRRIDHAYRIMKAIGIEPLERIQCPYQTQQANPQMVQWAKDNRRLLTISRELMVWRVE